MECLQKNTDNIINKVSWTAISANKTAKTTSISFDSSYSSDSTIRKPNKFRRRFFFVLSSTILRKWLFHRQCELFVCSSFGHLFLDFPPPTQPKFQEIREFLTLSFCSFNSVLPPQTATKSNLFVKFMVPDLSDLCESTPD